MPSSSRIVAVFGATGVQGSAVVERLLKDGTFAPRAITRDLNSASSLKLKDHGVEVVKGDIGDKASLVTALRGAEAVFAVTFPKMPRFGEDGPDEITQGKNIVDAAKEVGVKFFVFSSIPDSRKISSKKIPPHDDKQVIQEYLKSSGLAHATLLLGSFVENLWEHKTLEKTPTGFNIGIPKYDPTSLQAFTWVGRDLAESTLTLFKSYTDADPAKNVNGKTYPVVTANMCYSHLAAMISKALGVEVTYTKLDTCGIPVLDDMFEIRSQNGGLFSNTQIPNPDLVVLGAKFSTMEEVMEVEVKKRFGQ